MKRTLRSINHQMEDTQELSVCTSPIFELELWKYLPVELACLIFAIVPESTIPIIRQTCQKWKEAAEHKSIWESRLSSLLLTVDIPKQGPDEPYLPIEQVTLTDTNKWYFAYVFKKKYWGWNVMKNLHHLNFQYISEPRHTIKIYLDKKMLMTVNKCVTIYPINKNGVVLNPKRIELTSANNADILGLAPSFLLWLDKVHSIVNFTRFPEDLKNELQLRYSNITTITTVNAHLRAPIEVLTTKHNALLFVPEFNGQPANIVILDAFGTILSNIQSSLAKKNCQIYKRNLVIVSPPNIFYSQIPKAPQKLELSSFQLGPKFTEYCEIFFDRQYAILVQPGDKEEIILVWNIISGEIQNSFQVNGGWHDYTADGVNRKIVSAYYDIYQIVFLCSDKSFTYVTVQGGFVPNNSVAYFIGGKSTQNFTSINFENTVKSDRRFYFYDQDIENSVPMKAFTVANKLYVISEGRLLKMEVSPISEIPSKTPSLPDVYDANLCNQYWGIERKSSSVSAVIKIGLALRTLFINDKESEIRDMLHQIKGLNKDIDEIILLWNMHCSLNNDANDIIQKFKNSSRKSSMSDASILDIVQYVGRFVASFIKISHLFPFKNFNVELIIETVRNCLIPYITKFERCWLLQAQSLPLDTIQYRKNGVEQIFYLRKSKEYTMLPLFCDTRPLIEDIVQVLWKRIVSSYTQFWEVEITKLKEICDNPQFIISHTREKIQYIKENIDEFKDDKAHLEAPLAPRSKFISAIILETCKQIGIHDSKLSKERTQLENELQHLSGPRGDRLVKLMDGMCEEKKMVALRLDADIVQSQVIERMRAIIKARILTEIDKIQQQFREQEKSSDGDTFNNAKKAVQLKEAILELRQFVKELIKDTELETELQATIFPIQRYINEKVKILLSEPINTLLHMEKNVWNIKDKQLDNLEDQLGSYIDIDPPFVKIQLDRIQHLKEQIGFYEDLC